MPVTWDRLIDQAAYAAILPFFEAKLDHAQSLICRFKDPQHNYLTALKLIEGATQKDPNYVLLMDLMKASEKIETSWILCVLKAIDTPAWFIKYTEWVLHKDRNATPRIKQTLLQPLNMKRGIDMGRACSVLVFCCAIDPVLTPMPKLKVKEPTWTTPHSETATFNSWKRRKCPSKNSMTPAYKRLGTTAAKLG